MTYFCTATRVTPQNLTTHAHHCERPVHFQPVSPHTHEKKATKIRSSKRVHPHTGRMGNGNTRIREQNPTGSHSPQSPQPTAHSPQNPTSFHSPQPTAHRVPQSPQAPTESRLQELQGLQHMDPWAQKSKSLAAPAPFRVPPLRRRENPNTQPPNTPQHPPSPPAPNTQHSAHVYETRLGNDKKSLGFCKQKSLAEDKLLQPTQQTTTNYYYKLLHNKLQQTTSCYYYYYYYHYNKLQLQLPQQYAVKL